MITTVEGFGVEGFCPPVLLPSGHQLVQVASVPNPPGEVGEFPVSSPGCCTCTRAPTLQRALIATERLT